MKRVFVLILCLGFLGCVGPDWVKRADGHNVYVGEISAQKHLNWLGGDVQNPLKIFAYENQTYLISEGDGKLDIRVDFDEPRRLEIIAALDKAQEWGKITQDAHADAQKSIYAFKQNPMAAYNSMEYTFLAVQGKWCVVLRLPVNKDFFIMPSDVVKLRQLLVDAQGKVTSAEDKKNFSDQLK